MKIYRIAIVVSHPIQHFCPQYTSWARLGNISLYVVFASKHGLTEYKDINFDKTISWSDIKLDFPHVFLDGAEGRAINNDIDSPDLKDVLNNFSPDAIITYGYSQKIQRRAAVWAKKKGTPIIMISDSELRQHRSLWKALIKKIFLPFHLKNYDYFLTVGDANEAYYRHYNVNDDKFVRCFFPIDVELYEQAFKDKINLRSHIRCIYGIPEHHKVILNVGKLVPWKRQRDLVEFSNKIQNTRDDVTVILVGAGKEESNLRAVCNNAGPGGVVFAGFIDPNLLVQYYCASDVYAVCAEIEPHSLAVSEAIYCGLPVIASDKCGSFGPTDDIRCGMNGFVYPCGNIDILTYLINFMINDLSTYEAMSLESIRISRVHQELAHGKALIQTMTNLSATSLWS